MIFADMTDSHDKRVEKLLANEDEITAELLRLSPIRTNFSLVGIRRRLNNIEIGVWVLVVLIALDLIHRW